jgi:hypothetical protein
MSDCSRLLIGFSLCCYHYHPHPPPILPSINAIAKPAIAASPILLPPSSKASGIIDSANITRIAPAANDISTDITKGQIMQLCSQ